MLQLHTLHQDRILVVVAVQKFHLVLPDLFRKLKDPLMGEAFLLLDFERQLAHPVHGVLEPDFVLLVKSIHFLDVLTVLGHAHLDFVQVLHELGVKDLVL